MSGDASDYAAKLGLVCLPKRWSYSGKTEYFYVDPNDVRIVMECVDLEDGKEYSSIGYRGTSECDAVGLPAADTLRRLAAGVAR